MKPKALETIRAAMPDRFVCDARVLNQYSVQVALLGDEKHDAWKGSDEEGSPLLVNTAGVSAATWASVWELKRAAAGLYTNNPEEWGALVVARVLSLMYGEYRCRWETGLRGAPPVHWDPSIPTYSPLRQNFVVEGAGAACLQRNVPDRLLSRDDTKVTCPACLEKLIQYRQQQLEIITTRAARLNAERSGQDCPRELL
jgi:hypothetical protein